MEGDFLHEGDEGRVLNLHVERDTYVCNNQFACCHFRYSASFLKCSTFVSRQTTNIEIVDNPV